METEKEQKRKYPKALIIVLILTIVVLAVLVFWLLTGQGRDSGATGGGLVSYDNAAQSGHLPGKTDEEIQAELNRVVEEGMFNISIASQILFENGQAEGTANIENIEANKYSMKVSVFLEDTGETVYESGAVKPGQYIEKIKLSSELPAGTYKASAIFSALDQESLNQVGQAAAKLTLIVEN